MQTIKAKTVDEAVEKIVKMYNDDGKISLKELFQNIEIHWLNAAEVVTVCLLVYKEIYDEFMLNDLNCLSDLTEDYIFP